MRYFKLTIAYDGTDFHGWQMQANKPTLQGEIVSVLQRLTQEKVILHGAGRTDAGVHALAQVVTFVTESSVPTANVVKALNDILPASVRVLEVTEAAADFHARQSARAKTYRYRIHRAPICPPFLARYVWHFPFPLNEAAMAGAAGLVEGEHDFTSFAAVDPARVIGESVDHEGHPSASLRASSVSPRERAGGPNSGNVRQIFSSRWERQSDELVYTVRGSGFLHHMVRNLVGTFILVGKGTWRVEDLTRILEARNRSAAGATAPPSGLYLVNVEY